MLRGDSLLKALRKWRDMTQLHLAFKTNIAQGYLSDIESGRRKGTVETLTAIAKALEAPPEWLLD
jgi:transcriptional regulator with XRE-family HTH domain